MSDLRRIAGTLASGRYTVTRLVDGSGVLLDVEGLQVLSLNETGMFLLDAIQRGVHEEEALAEALTREFEVDTGTARRDVRAFLAELERGIG